MNKIAPAFTTGDHVSYSSFPGTVVRLYSDGPTEEGRMYEVRLASGLICVCGSDLRPGLCYCSSLASGRCDFCTGSRHAADYNHVWPDAHK